SRRFAFSRKASSPRLRSAISAFNPSLARRRSEVRSSTLTSNSSRTRLSASSALLRLTLIQQAMRPDNENRRRKGRVSRLKTGVWPTRGKVVTYCQRREHYGKQPWSHSAEPCTADYCYVKERCS